MVYKTDLNLIHVLMKINIGVISVIVLRACLEFISSWKSIIYGSDKEIIYAFSELNKLII